MGVIMYELLIGVTPFFSSNRNMLFAKIQKSKVVFPDRKKYKIDYSDEFSDLVTQLLKKDKTKRLGSGPNDCEEIMQHPFFKDIDFVKLANKELEPPFKPNIPEKDYTKFFNAEQGIDETRLNRREKQIVKLVIQKQLP